MPVYDYMCDDCGPFQEMVPMAKFADPCDCPACGTQARRLLTIPQLSGLSTATRSAHETNERAADSPKRSKQHGPGCGCCGTSKKIGSKTLHRPDGSKSFPTKRPWMISH
ncbi:MAG: zinc ribbon domain-containing protein [Pseudomonadota bacterium]